MIIVAKPEAETEKCLRRLAGAQHCAHGGEKILVGKAFHLSSQMIVWFSMADIPDHALDFLVPHHHVRAYKT